MLNGNGSAVLDLNAISGSTSFDAGAGFTVPAELLFHGEFKRAGTDLKIVGEHGKAFVVHDYFKTDHPHTLFAPDGAALTGDIVAALAGPLAPGEYAQATPPQSDATPIGRVATVEGTAVAVRNGVAVTLNIGDAVLKGDVVQTQGGSKVGIIFGDGTTFDLAANARMVLSDFVYNPAPGSANSAFINLVQGSITFIAGQVAHTGDMKVGTPVATMGIRGTAVQVDIDVNLGTTKLSVLFEPVLGRSGAFQVFSLSGQLIANVNDYNGQWTVTPTGPLDATATEVLKTPDQLAQALVAVQSAFQTQQLGQIILQQQPVPPSPQQPNQNPTQNTPKTQIQSSDLSTTKVHVDATETATGTTTAVSTSGEPGTVPLVLAPPPPTITTIVPTQEVVVVNTPAFFETNSDHITVAVNNSTASPHKSGVLLFTDTVGDSHSVTFTPHAGNVGTLSGVSITQDTSATAEGDIAYTYTGPRGQTHVDVFDVTVTDSAGNVTSTTISFDPENLGPVVADVNLTATEAQVAAAHVDTKLVLPNLLANVTDIESSHIAVSSIGTPTVSDPGSGLTFVVTAEAAGAGEAARYGIDVKQGSTDYGDAHFAVGSDGQVYLWSDNGTDPFQALGVSQNATIDFAYTVTDDQGGFNSAHVAIAVNGSDDAPVLTLPGNSVNTDGVAVNLTGAHVADPDIGDVITLDLSVQHGSLAAIDSQNAIFAAGITIIDGDGSDGTLRVSGSALAINNLVNHGLTYTPDNTSAHDTLTMTVQDAAGASDTQTVAIADTIVPSTVAEGSFPGANANDTHAIIRINFPFTSPIIENVNLSGGIDWHLDASADELTLLAGQRQIYVFNDTTNPAANQVFTITVGGGGDQFQFSAGSGANSYVNFSTATAQDGHYIGDSVDLVGFAGLTKAELLIDLTPDSFHNPVFHLGQDSITFQDLTLIDVQALIDAGHITINGAPAV